MGRLPVMTTPQTDGTQALALIDQLIALRGAGVGEIGRALGVTFQPASLSPGRWNHLEADFTPSHLLRHITLRRPSQRSDGRGIIMLDFSERVCLRRGDLDRHFAAPPVPRLISPPVWMPGMPLTPHPGEWITWSYAQDWGTVGVQYVSFKDAASLRRDCVHNLSLSWPPANGPRSA